MGRAGRPEGSSWKETGLRLFPKQEPMFCRGLLTSHLPLSRRSTSHKSHGLRHKPAPWLHPSHPSLLSSPRSSLCPQGFPNFLHPILCMHFKLTWEQLRVDGKPTIIFTNVVDPIHKQEINSRPVPRLTAWTPYMYTKICRRCSHSPGEQGYPLHCPGLLVTQHLVHQIPIPNR